MALRLILDPFYFIEGRHMKPGGKGGGKAPAAPDPAATAAAQGQMSKDVALWNSGLNNVNQVTPFGNLTWTLGTNTNSAGAPQYDYDAFNASLNAYNSGQQNNGGTQWYVDPYGNVTQNAVKPGAGLGSGSGNTPLNIGGGNSGAAPKLSDYQIGGATSDLSGLPQWTSTTTLSPESQAIFDSYMRQQQQLGGLSESALNQVSNAYSSPYNYDSLAPLYGESDLNAARKSTEDAIYSRLDPKFAQDEEAMRTRLINQGIGQGSQAYQREMDAFNQMKTDARMQAVLAGGTESDRQFAQSLATRQQGIGEIDKLRAQPLNEYLAMSGQQQLAMPQFQQYNYQGAGTPDYTGLVNNQYQSQLANYNAKQASSNNLMGGLFGLGGQALGGFLGSGAGSTALAGLFSDARLKDNIKPVGYENGFPVYEFNYIKEKGLPEGRFIGVMAQDVEQIMPEAIGESDGYKTVNYEMIGVKMREVSNG